MKITHLSLATSASTVSFLLTTLGEETRINGGLGILRAVMMSGVHFFLFANFGPQRGWTW